MQKLIELPKDETILVASKVEQFLQPDFVYLPVFNNTLNIQKNAEVYIGTFIAANVFSSVSGNAKRLVKMDSLTSSQLFLEIENNFQERRFKESFTKKRLRKEDILAILELHNKKNIVLNALDNEVYVATESFYLSLYYEDILELLDEIRGYFDVNIYVCIKASNSENINKLMDELGMYPHIILKVLPDLYLLAKPSFLISYLDLPEDDTLVVSASSFYQLYNYLKKGRVESTKLITISGNAIKRRMVIEAKLGTRLKDIVTEFYTLDNNWEFIANGLMSGDTISIDNFVITKDFDALLIMKKEEEKESGNCINCGLCSEICPVGIKPILLNNAKYLNKVKDNCINCGLCSYICPVYIKFNKYLKGESHE